MLSTLFTLWLSLSAQAFMPAQELLDSPALLVSYRDFSSHAERFNESGSGTLAFRELVEILYDHDNGRPWGDAYLPEVNKRLKKFREIVCSSAPIASACITPEIVWSPSHVAKLQKAMLDIPSLAALSNHWNLEISPWNLSLRPASFSLLVGLRGESTQVKVNYWDMPARSIRWQGVRQALVSDKDIYRAGFDSKDYPAFFAHSGAAMRWNDWLLRDHSMALAQVWKYERRPRARNVAPNPIYDSGEILFQSMFESNAKAFESKYAELHKLVSGEHAVRFEKERQANDYPEEVYQHIAYAQLKELMMIQGSYFSAAQIERKGTSDRQKVLESLLTMQRYTTAGHTFIMELSTLMEPMSSSAYVLNAVADAPVAQVLAMEQLNAVLGLDIYEGKALFPKIGGGLVDPELFRPSYLNDYAPDVKEALHGRDFLKLDAQEQIRIMAIYLKPNPARMHMQALYRLATLLFVKSSEEELRQIAEAVHEARKANFK